MEFNAPQRYLLKMHGKGSNNDNNVKLSSIEPFHYNNVKLCDVLNCKCKLCVVHLLCCSVLLLNCRYQAKRVNFSASRVHFSDIMKIYIVQKKSKFN